MLMSEAQWTKKDVLQRYCAGVLTAAEAATILKRSERQLRRMVARHRAGQPCIVHGNTGRAPSNKTPDGVKAKVLELLKGPYAGFNETHFVELLAEREGISVSKSTTRRWARAAGISATKKRRSRRHRQRRVREGRAGALLLWDGSTHEWLERRGPRMCLVAAIDDATGEVMPGAHFVSEECAVAYLRVLAAVVREKGIPLRLYMDRHGSLKRNDDNWTLEEELAGQQLPTQVGQALADLRIEVIYALSPEAKGRIERLWGTLQDRLVSELRLEGVSSLDGANEFLSGFLRRHNKRFGVEAAESQSAWRRLPPGLDVEDTCAFRYLATVSNDNVVSIDGVKLQIPRPVGGRSFAKARVDVRQLLDGRWRIRLNGTVIASFDAQGPARELRARRRKSRPAASRAFREAVRTFEAPPEKRAVRPKQRRPPRPYNFWTKQQKLAAAQKSKQLRAQRPTSW